MEAASIAATLEQWGSSLRDVKVRIRLLFTQDRLTASAGLFLDGLLKPERHKTGWLRAEAAGDPGPWPLQAGALRDMARNYALETLAARRQPIAQQEIGVEKA